MARAKLKRKSLSVSYFCLSIKVSGDRDRIRKQWKRFNRTHFPGRPFRARKKNILLKLPSDRQTLYPLHCSTKRENCLLPTRKGDFRELYRAVVQAIDLLDLSFLGYYVMVGRAHLDVSRLSGKSQVFYDLSRLL